MQSPTSTNRKQIFLSFLNSCRQWIFFLSHSTMPGHESSCGSSNFYYGILFFALAFRESGATSTICGHNVCVCMLLARYNTQNKYRCGRHVPMCFMAGYHEITSVRMVVALRPAAVCLECSAPHHTIIYMNAGFLKDERWPVMTRMVVDIRVCGRSLLHHRFHAVLAWLFMCVAE